MLSPPRRHKPSLTGRLRLVFGIMEAALAVFLIAAIWYAWQVDLQTRQFNAWEKHSQAVLQLEEFTRAQTARILDELNGFLHVPEREPAENSLDLDQKSLDLMKAWLTPQEMQRISQGRMPPVLGVADYRLTISDWKRISEFLHRIFETSEKIPNLSEQAYQEIQLLRDQKVPLMIDGTRQVVSVSGRDWHRLDPLDGKLDGKLVLPAFQEELNPTIFDFRQEGYERVREPLIGQSNRVEELERPAVWIMCYVSRMSTRLGVSHHAHADFVLSLFGSSPLKTRNQVIHTRTGKIRMAYQWEFFPRHFGEIPEEDHPEVALYPQKTKVAWLNETRLQRSLVPKALKELSEDLSFRIVFPDGEELGTGSGWERLNLGAQESDRAEIGEGFGAWWISRSHSEWLDGATIHVGEPVIFSRQESLVWLILWLVLLGVGLSLSHRMKRKVLEFLEASISYTLRFLLASGSDKRAGLGGLVTRQDARELKELRESMQAFTREAGLVEQNLQFDLRLQRIIAEPRQSLEWYLEEIWYAAHAVDETLGFERMFRDFRHANLLIEIGGVIRGGVRLPENTARPGSLRVLKSRLLELGNRISLQEKHEYGVSTRAELDLGRKMRQGLQKGGEVFQTREFQVEYAQMPGELPGGDFAIAIKDEGSFLAGTGTILGRGMGAAMLASSISVFLQTLWHKGMGLEDVCESLIRELEELSTQETWLSLALVLCHSHQELEYISFGHWPFLVENGTKEELMEACGPPLGPGSRVPQIRKIPVKRENTRILMMSGSWMEHGGGQSRESCLAVLKMLAPDQMEEENGPKRSHAHVRITRKVG